MNLLSRLPESDVVAAHPVVAAEIKQLRALEALRKIPRSELDSMCRDMGVNLAGLDTESALRKAAELGTAAVGAPVAAEPAPITAVPTAVTAPMPAEESAYARSHAGWKGDERARVLRPEPGDLDFESQFVGARPCPRWLRGAW